MKHNYLLGVYDDDDTLLHAVKKIKEAGFHIREIYTPFPVHGLDEAWGLQDTRLHTMGFVFGALGTLTAFTLMTFVGLDWKTIVGGKPYFNLPSMGPVMFELTVLFCAVGMTVTYYLRNRFSIFRDQEIVHPRITDDRFVTLFCLKQYRDSGEQTRLRELLHSTGAVEVAERSLEEEVRSNGMKAEDGGHHDHGHHH